MVRTILHLPCFVFRMLLVRVSEKGVSRNFIHLEPLAWHLT